METHKLHNDLWLLEKEILVQQLELCYEKGERG